MTVAPETLLLAGYSVFLLAVAAVLDRLARHSHARADRYRTAGFAYRPEHDVWVCPQDQMLWPSRYDEGHHLMRYRAKPSVCNACPVKRSCTSSDHGREISVPTEPRPHSEAARFHRGIVLVLVVLAAVSIVSIRVLREYDRGVLFRLGRLRPLAGPGLVFLLPFVDRLVRVDLRTVTLTILPQEIITRDNVPARVNAVAYFRVVDPTLAVTEVEAFPVATSQIAQTTLR